VYEGVGPRSRSSRSGAEPPGRPHRLGRFPHAPPGCSRGAPPRFAHRARPPVRRSLKPRYRHDGGDGLIPASAGQQATSPWSAARSTASERRIGASSAV